MSHTDAKKRFYPFRLDLQHCPQLQASEHAVRARARTNTRTGTRTNTRTSISTSIRASTRASTRTCSCCWQPRSPPRAAMGARPPACWPPPAQHSTIAAP